MFSEQHQTCCLLLWQRLHNADRILRAFCKCRHLYLLHRHDGHCTLLPVLWLPRGKSRLLLQVSVVGLCAERDTGSQEWPCDRFLTKSFRQGVRYASHSPAWTAALCSTNQGASISTNSYPGHLNTTSYAHLSTTLMLLIWNVSFK